MQARLSRIWVVFIFAVLIFTVQLLISGAQETLPTAAGEPLGVIPDDSIFEIQEQIVGDTTKEAAVATMINQLRQTMGLQCWRYNDTLVTAQRLHLKDMAERDYFSHNTPEGLTPKDRANNAGYDGFATESLTAGRETPEQAFTSWRASRLHNRGFFFNSREMGVGYLFDSESRYKYYYGLLQGSQTGVDGIACTGTSLPPMTHIPNTLTISQNNTARPTITWNHQASTADRIQATKYAFEIVNGTDAFDTVVLPVADNGDIDASTLCSGASCSWKVSADLPNGEYTVFIRAWSETGGHVWTGDSGVFGNSAEALKFTVNITEDIITPTPVPTGDPNEETETPTPTPTDEGESPAAPLTLSVLPNQGRPTITWANDENAQWFNFWIIGTDGQGIALGDAWYPSDAEGVPFANSAPLKAQCAGLTCTIKPDTDPLAGDYQVWMRSWGNNQYSTGGSTGYDGWSMAEFSLPNTPPSAATGLTATLTATGSNEVTFRWQGSARATWYNVWVGSDGEGDPPWQSVFFDWMLAEDLSCENAGTCTLRSGVKAFGGTANLNLPDGEYIWYVQSWGPGGFSTGGIDGTSWVEADKFTVP